MQIHVDTRESPANGRPPQYQAVSGQRRYRQAKLPQKYRPSDNKANAYAGRGLGFPAAVTNRRLNASALLLPH